MSNEKETGKDSPLPATTTFVFVFGILIVVGWTAMYLLLRSRW